jgi:hypothetical protein
MALDPVVEVIEAQIREHEKDLANLKKMLRIAHSIVPPSVLGSDSQPKRRPNAWNVADDIEELLGAGPLSEEGLLGMIVEKNMVKGDTTPLKVANARKAITRGVNIGYLRRVGDTIAWMPGIRVNTRIAKIHLHR